MPEQEEGATTPTAVEDGDDSDTTIPLLFEYIYGNRDSKETEAKSFMCRYSE